MVYGVCCVATASIFCEAELVTLRLELGLIILNVSSKQCPRF